jgi:hypothetical protein
VCGRDFRRCASRKRLIQTGESVTAQSLAMPRSLKPSAWTAFALYLALSWTIFGRSLAGHFSDRLIGLGPDPALFVFFLAWWHYVAINHLNPFMAHVIWAPNGFNLAWSTFVPLAGIFAAPITQWFGVVPAYNASMLLCPALSALTAFILCRRICARFWPALAGGYVFGFSAYMLSHMLGHLTLVMEFFPPLAVYLVMRRIEGDLSACRFTMLLALVLIGQIGSSLEILATMTIFGGVAILVRWYLSGRELRSRIVALGIPITCAYVIAALFASPYLYYFFVSGPPGMATNLATIGAATPANLAVPSPVNALGIWRWMRALSSGQNLYETSGYVGLPMLLLVWSLARSRWREARVKLAVVMLLIICVASFGPDLLVHGGHVLPMPWKPFTWMPLLRMAEPGRFALLGFLCLGVILALWSSDDSRGLPLRLTAAALVIGFTLPNPSAMFWITADDTPAFFANGKYRDYVAPGANLLILPYGIDGNSDLWQSRSEMYFRMAGGYVGLSPAIPAQYQPWPIVYALYNLAEIPDLRAQVNAFLVQKQVTTVIVAETGSHLWEPLFDAGPLSFRQRPFTADERAAIRAMFAALDPSPLEIDGVTLYRIPLARLSPYAQIDPRDLERCAAQARLNALIIAADDYQRSYRPLGDLNPLSAARLGLLPKMWLIGPNAESDLRSYAIVNGLVLTAVGGDRIALGLRGTPGVLKEMARTYGSNASSQAILPPMLAFSAAEQTQSLLLMTYSREQLSRASAVARTQQTVPVCSQIEAIH